MSGHCHCSSGAERLPLSEKRSTWAAPVGFQVVKHVGTERRRWGEEGRCRWTLCPQQADGEEQGLKARGTPAARVAPIIQG